MKSERSFKEVHWFKRKSALADKTFWKIGKTVDED